MRRKELIKNAVVVVLAFLFVYSLINHVFANPIPINPPPISGTPMEYFIIFTAEAFGLLVGVGMLTRNSQTRWQKAAMTMAVALVASYVVGMTIWTSGYVAGVSLYNPLVLPPRGTPNLPGLIIVLLPEFVGTIIGGIIIHEKHRTYWKTAFGTMALAMLTSLLAGSLLVTVFLS